MPNIRINALPSEATPSASDVVAIDNVTTRKTTLSALVNAARPFASQPEAEAGDLTDKTMAPLTTKQAIIAIGGGLYASVSQGALAASAVQPGDLSAVATSGAYGDLTGTPTLGTAAATASSDYAPIAQAVPTAGATGYVLTKATAADNDVYWADPAAEVLLDGSVTPIKLDATQVSGFQSLLEIGDFYRNALLDGALEGNNAIGDKAKIAALLADQPFRKTLAFPTDRYQLDPNTRVERKMNFDFDGSIFIAEVAAGQDILRVAVKDVGSGSGVGDNRDMQIRNGSVFPSVDGLGSNGLNINPADGLGPYLPTFNMTISGMNIAAKERAVRIGAPNVAGDANFNTVKNSTLSTQSTGAEASFELDGAADGNRLLESMCFGSGASVRVNVVFGAYNTTVMSNALLNRDGATLIANGSRVTHINNQCEQQGGINTLGSTVMVQGLDYKSIGNLFLANNYGGGTDVDRSMQFFNAVANVVDYCQFNKGAVEDIAFTDGGSGLIPNGNLVGPNNWPRQDTGSRAIRDANVDGPTDATRRLVISMSATAREQRGVWRPHSHITFANGCTGEDLEFMVDEWGILRFNGSFRTGATVTLGTLFFTLPPSCRPTKQVNLPLVNENGNFSSLFVFPSGNVTAGSGILASQIQNMGAVQIPVLWLLASMY